MSGRAGEQATTGSLPGVLLAPASELLGAVLRAALLDTGRVEVLGLVRPEDAAGTTAALLPDVLVLTAGRDADSAPRLLPAVRRAAPATAVLVLTPAADPDTLLAVMSAGAAGCVSLDADVPELEQAVHSVARGEVALSGSRLASVVDRLARPTGGTEARGRASTLTPRELIVLRCLANGATTAEITEALGCSAPTARTHIQNVLGKLGVHSRLEAAAYAEAHGLW